MSNLLSYLPHIIYACIFISRISNWLLFTLIYSYLQYFIIHFYGYFHYLFDD